MRSIFLPFQYVFPAVFLLNACALFNKEKAVERFPGHYQRSFSGPYSQGEDELVIELLTENGNVYRVQHLSHFQRRLNGTWGATETKTEQWTALYDTEKKILREQRGGKIISLSADEETLYVGTNAYHKTKP